MPAPPRKYRLGVQQRLALRFFAGSPFGATEAAMFLNGFARHTLVRLIRAGLATTEREDLEGGSRSIGRIRITEAGRPMRSRLLIPRSFGGGRGSVGQSCAGTAPLGPNGVIDELLRRMRQDALYLADTDDAGGPFAQTAADDLVGEEIALAFSPAAPGGLVSRRLQERLKYLSCLQT
jgi:hypothetical protein